eukprot:TRINITY_DN32148_c0_g1_i1.p1 TRINITY_DN32148_c0_g1~~TRINITY_DN32148_c0_g1_i1.p1  ORF type:complete len:851 (-),score=181.04 TRINITY_DN32148_c0_g1_i1:20-2572(-)
MAKRHLQGMLLNQSSPVRPSSRQSEDAPRPGSPTNAIKRTSQPTPAWHDVLDLCKKGFATKMDVMGDEVLQQVRAEVQGALRGVVKELMDALDVRETAANRKLGELAERIKIVQETAENGRDSLLQLDLARVTNEIRSNEEAHHASTAKMLQTAGNEIAQIREQLNQSRALAEAEAEKTQQLSQQLAEGNTKQDSDSQLVRAATSEISRNLEKMSKEVAGKHAKMEQQLQELLSRTESLPSTSDVRSVESQVKRTESVLNIDFNLILTEVSKIQKNLHMEFVEAAEFHGQSTQHAKGWSSSADSSELIPGPPGRPPPVMEQVLDADDEGESQMQQSEVVEVGVTKHEGTMSLGLKIKKRSREYWTQTEVRSHKDESSQTDPKLSSDKLQRKKTVQRFHKLQDEPPSATKPVFADAEAMKAKARMALVKPQYNVMDLYHDKGFAQQLARNSYFDSVTLGVVCVNSLWMAIDTDYNNEVLIQDMHPVFICGEMFFCAYFTFEVVIRFLAFAKKRSCLTDAWFVFDSFLVFIMVLETWILPIMILLWTDLAEILETLNLGTLRLIRMVKILRLTRMAKLLRLFPELKIIVKGIRFAFRSVGVFFLLWMMIIFVCAIVLTQLNSSFATTKEFGNLFKSVSISIETLLLNGIMPQQADLLRVAMGAHPFFWVLLMGFVLLASVTIMYMLVGVLVEVMSAISVTEKEGMTVSFVATQLRETMEASNYDLERSLSQVEFSTLLTQTDVARIVTGVGVDIGVLLDMMDIIYEDLQKKGIVGLSFESMVELILNLRGANTATVKDVKELLRVLKAIFKENFNLMQKKIHEEFNSIKSDLGALRDANNIEDEWGDEDAGS